MLQIHTGGIMPIRPGNDTESPHGGSSGRRPAAPTHADMRVTAFFGPDFTPFMFFALVIRLLLQLNAHRQHARPRGQLAPAHLDIAARIRSNGFG